MENEVINVAEEVVEAAVTGDNTTKVFLCGAAFGGAITLGAEHGYIWVRNKLQAKKAKSAVDVDDAETEESND